LGTAILILWRRLDRRPAVTAQPSSDGESWRPLFESLEKQVGQHGQQLTTAGMQWQALSSQVQVLSQQVSHWVQISIGRPADLPSRGTPEPDPPGAATTRPWSELEQQDASGRQAPLDLDPEAVGRMIEDVLNSTEFKDELWPELFHDFYTCRTRLSDFLLSRGLSNVEINSYPPLREGNPNHWEFALVQPRRKAPDALGCLIPRHFGRYDPSFHCHLFKIEGQSRDSDSYFRELRRCALLHPPDHLEGRIDSQLIVEPGIVSISPSSRH
jgi:hypothetical protein